MSKVRIGMLILLVGILGVGTVSAQQSGGVGTLTGQDYGEIEALYARYNQGVISETLTCFSRRFLRMR